MHPSSLPSATRLLLFPIPGLVDHFFLTAHVQDLVTAKRNATTLITDLHDKFSGAKGALTRLALSIERLGEQDSVVHGLPTRVHSPTHTDVAGHTGADKRPLTFPCARQHKECCRSVFVRAFVHCLSDLQHTPAYVTAAVVAAYTAAAVAAA
jgi:hypothetical protein